MNFRGSEPRWVVSKKEKNRSNFICLMAVKIVIEFKKYLIIIVMDYRPHLGLVSFISLKFDLQTGAGKYLYFSWKENNGHDVTGSSQ